MLQLLLFLFFCGLFCIVVHSLFEYLLVLTIFVFHSFHVWLCNLLVSSGIRSCNVSSLCEEWFGIFGMILHLTIFSTAERTHRVNGEPAGISADQSTWFHWNEPKSMLYLALLNATVSLILLTSKSSYRTQRKTNNKSHAAIFSMLLIGNIFDGILAYYWWFPMGATSRVYVHRSWHFYSNFNPLIITIPLK